MVSAGQTATATVTVTESNIAKTMKSGSLEVFATPAMCALMEEAAQAAVRRRPKRPRAQCFGRNSPETSRSWLQGHRKSRHLEPPNQNADD
mgnify:CR=1 FL=1